jgi:hypothetical protein
MTRVAGINELILKNVQDLSEKEKREVLNYIEYLRIKEDQSFIQYVNERTKEAVKAKRRGEGFISLKKLQKEYA